MRPKMPSWTETRLAKAATAAGRATPFPAASTYMAKLASCARFPYGTEEPEVSGWRLSRSKTLRQMSGLTGRLWNQYLQTGTRCSSTDRVRVATAIADHPDERLVCLAYGLLDESYACLADQHDRVPRPLLHPLDVWQTSDDPLQPSPHAPTDLAVAVAQRTAEMLAAQLAAKEVFTPLQRVVLRSWQRQQHRLADAGQDSERLARLQALHGGAVEPREPPTPVRGIYEALGAMAKTFATHADVVAWCNTLEQEEITPAAILSDILPQIPAYQTRSELEQLLRVPTLGTGPAAASLAEAVLLHPLMRSPTDRADLGRRILTAAIFGVLSSHRGVESHYQGWVDGVMPELLQRLDQDPTYRLGLETAARHALTQVGEGFHLADLRSSLEDYVQDKDLGHWPVLWRVIPRVLRPTDPLTAPDLEQGTYTWLRWADGPQLTEALIGALRFLGTLEEDQEHLMTDLTDLIDARSLAELAAIPRSAWAPVLKSPMKALRLWAVQRVGRVVTAPEAPAPPSAAHRRTR